MWSGNTIKSFRDCRDWSKLFENPAPPFPTPASRPSSSVIFPDLSRPNSKDTIRANRQPLVPPATPVHKKPGDFGDPAIQELKQQWNWKFSSHKAVVECSNCNCAIPIKLLEGHLRLCKTACFTKQQAADTPRHDKHYVA